MAVCVGEPKGVFVEIANADFTQLFRVLSEA